MVEEENYVTVIYFRQREIQHTVSDRLTFFPFIAKTVMYVVLGNDQYQLVNSGDVMLPSMSVLS